MKGNLVSWIMGFINTPNVREMQVQQINKRITLLQRKLAPLEELERQGKLYNDEKRSRLKHELDEKIFDLQKQIIRLSIYFA